MSASHHYHFILRIHLCHLRLMLCTHLLMLCTTTLRKTAISHLDGPGKIMQRCPGQRRELNGSTLLEYLSRVDFINPFTENRVTFDNNGSAPGRYTKHNCPMVLYGMVCGELEHGQFPG